MAFGDEDLPALFADMGVTVVKGVESTLGILDDAENLVAQGLAPGMTGRGLALLLRTGALSNLAVDDALTVGGTPYVVRERLRLDDGALSAVALRTP